MLCNLIANFFVSRSRGWNIRRRSRRQHQICKCRYLITKREWRKFHLRIRSHRGCKMWCIPERERYVQVIHRCKPVWRQPLTTVVATDVEGIFRLSGSAKRIKDLQTVFNSPDRYGKGLDWTGYTVHDAANILRRYLNQLPEPIVPLDFYERFRDPLRATQVPGPDGEMHPRDLSVSEHSAAVTAYQKLIKELPPLNRQLLLYILDLLAVFASKSDLNRMTAANLAAIFQPGIISHP